MDYHRIQSAVDQLGSATVFQTAAKPPSFGKNTSSSAPPRVCMEVALPLPLGYSPPFLPVKPVPLVIRASRKSIAFGFSKNRKISHTCRRVKRPKLVAQRCPFKVGCGHRWLQVCCVKWFVALGFPRNQSSKSFLDRKSLVQRTGGPEGEAGPKKDVKRFFPSTRPEKLGPKRPPQQHNTTRHNKRVRDHKSDPTDSSALSPSVLLPPPFVAPTLLRSTPAGPHWTSETGSLLLSLGGFRGPSFSRKPVCYSVFPYSCPPAPPTQRNERQSQPARDIHHQLRTTKVALTSAVA